MYQGFLISNYNTGYHTTKEPWLAPQDAFVEMQNCHLTDGVLSKRLGYQAIAQMKHGAAVQTYPVTGVWMHSSRGYRWLIACDTLRPCVLGDSAFVDISGGSDLFSGTWQNLFKFLTLDDKTYFTNNTTDGVFMFNGASFDISSPTAVTSVNLNLDSGAMTTVNMLFHLADRLMCYDVTEGGVYRPYRLRYSQALAVGNTPVWTDGYYLDIPTDDFPVCGRRLGKYVYIWHRKSLWVIRPTGDTAIPFAPDRVRTDLGGTSPFCCIPFEKGLLTIGHHDLLYFDGYATRKLNVPHLHDMISNFTWSALRYSYGAYDEPRQKVYIAMTDSSVNDRILEYDIENKNWTVHTVQALCMTFFDGSGFIPWDDADASFAYDGATLAEMPIEGTSDAGVRLSNLPEYPVIGKDDGFVYRLFNGTDDDGSDIDWLAKSAQLNPFKEKGLRASLGRVAVLVDTDATASFSIRLYKNGITTAYKTQTISCAGTGAQGGARHWETLHAGCEIGDFHTIEFYHSASANTPKVHATWLEMEPAGHIDP